MSALSVTEGRYYKKGLPDLRSSKQAAKNASLRKHVLLKCFHAQKSTPPISEDNEMPVSLSDEQATTSRTPRRRRTHLPGAQRVIQNRINELKRLLRGVYSTAQFLRHTAALRRCPVDYTGEPKAYFNYKLRQLSSYISRHLLDWVTELRTLLGALREPPWDTEYWHNSLSLVLDSIQVVLENMEDPEERTV